MEASVSPSAAAGVKNTLKRMASSAASVVVNQAPNQSANRLDGEASEALVPYQLFCSGNYFGEIELIDSGSRRSTVRCESATGLCMMLGKTDVFQFSQEFPQ